MLTAAPEMSIHLFLGNDIDKHIGIRTPNSFHFLLFSEYRAVPFVVSILEPTPQLLLAFLCKLDSLAMFQSFSEIPFVFHFGASAVIEHSLAMELVVFESTFIDFQ